MGGAVSSGRSNEDLIWKLKQAGYIETVMGEVLMKLVDRRFYVITDEVTSYYRDTAWQQDDLHMSAPCIYAEVFEKLDLHKGQSFLNLGSGTGYLSTLIGLVLGSMGTNHGVELKKKPFDYSIERLETFMNHHKAMQIIDFAKPVFFQGNALRLQTTIKYDRIYCGASIEEADIPYFTGFLKEGGILLFPQYDKDQLIRLKKDAQGTITYEPQLNVSFASMVRANFFTTPVTLAPHQPHSLVHLCRRKVLRCVRAHVITDSYNFCASMTAAHDETKFQSETNLMSSQENRLVFPPDFFYKTYVLDLPYSPSTPPEPIVRPVSEELKQFRAVEGAKAWEEGSFNDFDEFLDCNSSDIDSQNESSRLDSNDFPMRSPGDDYNCQGISVKSYSYLRSPSTEKYLINYSTVIGNAVDSLPLPPTLKKFIMFNQS